MSKIILVHGFGVRSDFKLLLPDIEQFFMGKGYETSRLEFYDWHESTKQLHIHGLRSHVRKISVEINADDQETILIAHSQGSVAAAMLNDQDCNRVTKVILLAPPSKSSNGLKTVIESREGGIFDPDKISYLPRSDGTMTVIHPEYWTDIQNLDYQHLFKNLAQKTDLAIIQASADEILSSDSNNFDFIKNEIYCKNIDADHNFTGAARQELLNVLEDLVL